MDEDESHGDVVRMQQGDLDAFRRIVERYTPKVAVITKSVLGSQSSEWEDVAQEVFVKVWQARASLTSPAGFLSWLRTTATRTAIDAFRKKRPPPESEGTLARDDPAIVAETNDLVRKLLEMIPDPQRRADVFDHYINERSHAEIGTQTGRSSEAVRKSCERGIESIREILDERTDS
jgi:RNA polymerase sigma-70 factor (ECF subfamily)